VGTVSLCLSLSHLPFPKSVGLSVSVWLPSLFVSAHFTLIRGHCLSLSHSLPSLSAHYTSVLKALYASAPLSSLIVSAHYSSVRGHCLSLSLYPLSLSQLTTPQSVGTVCLCLFTLSLSQLTFPRSVGTVCLCLSSLSHCLSSLSLDPWALSVSVSSLSLCLSSLHLSPSVLSVSVSLPSLFVSARYTSVRRHCLSLSPFSFNYPQACLSALSVFASFPYLLSRFTVTFCVGSVRLCLFFHLLIVSSHRTSVSVSFPFLCV
jgi:hypothetical protein